MPSPDLRPYGSWPSPISVDKVVAGALSLREAWLDGDDPYWIERRPAEGGRHVVVRGAGDGTAVDITPAGTNARTMVHEYGGGSYTVADGVVYFSDLEDGGRVHRLAPGGTPEPISPEGKTRYADMRIDRSRQRLLCVREDHEVDGEPEHTLVAVALSGERVDVLVRGADFYSDPRISPDGASLSWLTWRHPDMPWDATELWVGRFAADGSLATAQVIAGGPGESIAQPQWAPDGSLVFASDRSGWWNLYRWRLEELAGAPPLALAPMQAEFADPQWVFDATSFGIDEDGTIVASARSEGTDRLHLVAPDGRTETVDLGVTEFGSVRVAGGRALFLTAGPSQSVSVVSLDLATRAPTVLRRAAEIDIDPAWISAPRPITFPTTDGEVAHAIFYPPAGANVRAPDGDIPPLVVISHGGPTSSASTALDLETQLFTSRGIAVVDVDYRGSTGYGRPYRERLNGQWGIVDLDDCCNAALHLAAAGEVDPARLAIRGGSAGGYTTLCAVTFRNVFRAGASHYGVGDLETLARDTHKFESRYLDRLVGPYPEQRDLYVERSPINFTDRISCPLIVLQGLDDMVVPPAQAEQLVAALDAKGLPHAYLCFEGEGHGFRRAENIKRALEAELSFYAQILGWELADDFEPVVIKHLPARA
jgi:dipeptidyl aminopeptidase/acylaminoacyl peptidase